MPIDAWGLDTPSATDQVDVPADMLALAVSMRSKIIPAFASTSARNAALTAPAEGQMAWITGGAPPQLTIFTASAWTRLVAADPSLPAEQVSTAGGSGINTIVSAATTWAGLPSFQPSVSVTNPHPSRAMIVQLSWGAWMASSASADLRLCPRVFGGVTIAAGPATPGPAGWGEIPIVTAGVVQIGQHSSYCFDVPAGASVTSDLQAYRSVAAGTQTVNYASLRLSPLGYRG
jgi:hypothetical protein